MRYLHSLEWQMMSQHTCHCSRTGDVMFRCILQNKTGTRNWSFHSALQWKIQLESSQGHKFFTLDAAINRGHFVCPDKTDAVSLSRVV